MNKDRIIGLLIFIGNILGIILYAWLLFFKPYTNGQLYEAMLASLIYHVQLYAKGLLRVNIDISF